jgi:hypothetical protein
MRVERPLFASCVDAAVFAEQTDKKFVVHFARADSFSRDSLLRENNRVFIEDLLRELSGKPLGFVAEIKDGLVQAPKPPIAEEPESPSAAPKTKVAAKKKIVAEPLAVPAAEPKAEEPVEVKAAEPVDPVAFFQDPLIQGALDLFDATRES